MRSKVVRTVIVSGAASVILLLTARIPHIPKLRIELPMAIEGVVPANGQTVACIGYDYQKDRWGVEHQYCPADHAFYGVDDPAGVKGPANRIRAVHACCPLPSKDILTEEHVFVSEECPENFVSTGSKQSGTGPDTEHLMRCTKINTDRYALSEERPSVYWGTGSAGWQEGSDRILWENIPASLRYSAGRQSKEKWDIDGCVGYPWGSLLSKKSSKYCSGLYFKQLQFTGKAGDPAAGTAVKMLPDCQEIEQVDNPHDFRCKS